MSIGGWGLGTWAGKDNDAPEDEDEEDEEDLQDWDHAQVRRYPFVRVWTQSGLNAVCVVVVGDGRVLGRDE